MIFKIIVILLLSALSGCKGGAGSPALNLPPDQSTPVDNNEESASLYSVKEYILPSMEIYSDSHGGFDINVANDETIVVAGLIKVFDPNLGSYPQKAILWNISDEVISFNELESGTKIFKTNYYGSGGRDQNYVRLVFDDGGLPLIGYINNSGKFKIISASGIVADTNIDCDHIASSFDEDLRAYRFSCLKNITVSNTDMKLNIINSVGNLIQSKTYTDKGSMNSSHAYKSRNGEPYVFVKNYANQNKEYNLSLLTNNGIQVLALGQLQSGNLQLSAFDGKDNLCATTSNITAKRYDVSQAGTSPLVGVTENVNKTLPSCLTLSSTESLFYNETSFPNADPYSGERGYILNDNGKKIFDLNTYGFKKIFTAKKIADDLFIIGIEAKTNQAKILKIRRL